MRAWLIASLLAVLGLGSVVATVTAASSNGSNNFKQTVEQAFALLPRIKRALTQNTSASTTPEIISEDAQVIQDVKNTSGAVVSIIASSNVPTLGQCTSQNSTSTSINLFPQDDLQFPLPLQEAPLCQNGTQLQRTGTGSGFIVSADGYILTNRHVVSDIEGQYTVVMNDAAHAGQKYKATVLARDPNDDIAVLKIDGKNLPFVHLGDSSKLQVGQTVIAIGDALGQFDNTVSKGIVSGLSRSIEAADGFSASETLHGLIQTDAAINPGNSGGPLLDLNGNVIGMNTAVANAQSIGFALPINELKAAYDEVRSAGKIAVVPQTFLGVRFQPITEELRVNLKLPYDYGMLIGHGASTNDVAVVTGSPADKAGLKDQDIILEADGKELNEQYDLADAVRAYKPGDKMLLKLYRQGVVETVSVTLGTK